MKVIGDNKNCNESLIRYNLEIFLTQVFWWLILFYLGPLTLN